MEKWWGVCVKFCIRTKFVLQKKVTNAEYKLLQNDVIIINKDLDSWVQRVLKPSNILIIGSSFNTFES